MKTGPFKALIAWRETKIAEIEKEKK